MLWKTDEIAQLQRPCSNFLMKIDLSTPEAFQKSWLDQPRPLFIVDECRQPKPGGGEFVLFAFIQTLTSTAVQWATEAGSIKNTMMAQGKLPKVLKGSSLFGNSQRKLHDPYRSYVKDKLKSCQQISFLLIDGTLLPAIVSSAPSRITTVDRDPAKGTANVVGRELSPFLNCLKAIAVDRKLADQTIDVLVDRSFQLGLDPSSRKISNDQFQLIGPGTIAPNLPNEFLFVSSGEEGGFSDLLVLPDSLAYMLFNLDHGYIDVRKAEIQKSGRLYYWHDVYSNFPNGLLR